VVVKESVVVGLGDNQPAGTAKSPCNFKGSVPAFPAREGGFVFKIKPFALMTQHPAEMSRLPKQLRERLPADKRSTIIQHSSFVATSGSCAAGGRFWAASRAIAKEICHDARTSPLAQRRRIVRGEMNEALPRPLLNVSS